MAAPRASLVLLLCAAACERPSPERQQQVVEKQDSSIACALEGAADFRRDCTVERRVDEQGPVLTLRAPDGGFRRLRIVADGRGLVAADGALPAQVTVVGEHEIEVAVGSDRYRLPATLK